MKEGPLGGILKVLSPEDITNIHNASMTLLEEFGFYCESDLLLNIYRKGGAIVDADTKMVRIGQDMINHALNVSPKGFVFHGRESKHDILLEPKRVYFGMGGTSEPHGWDDENYKIVSSQKNDVVEATRLGNTLSEIDFVMLISSAGDVSEETPFVHEYDAVLRNTTKPAILAAPGRKHAEFLFKMAAAISGGEQDFRDRPSVMLLTQGIEPLKYTTYMESIIEAANVGAPILVTPAPLMGATSPATLAGTIVQGNAEALAGIVLVQLVNEGNPVVYGPHTTLMDMKTTVATYASPEQAVGRAAVAQLGIHYGLPSFGLGGGTEAKIPDAQAGAEAMQGILINALSGLTLTQTLGTMGSGNHGSLVMLLICSELVRMVKRILDGFEVTPETMALDVIKDVGPGGHFLAHPHTMENFRNEFFFSELFDRKSPDDWVSSGSKAVDEVALEKVHKLKESYQEVSLPKSADTALHRILSTAEHELQEH